MKISFSRLKEKTKEIAAKRISRLFEIAREEAAKRPALARRYVKLAQELARKSQTKMPKNLRRSYCKECLLPFTSAGKVRTKKGFAVYTCSECGARRRFRIGN